MAVETAEAAPGGSPASVAVVGQAAGLVSGYSLAVGHDPGVALLEVRVSAPVAAHGAELVLSRVEDEAEAPFGALLVVLDAGAPFGDVPPIRLESAEDLATFVYEIPPDAPPGLAIELRLGHLVYGRPRVASIFVDEELDSIEPRLCDGALRVGSPFRRGDCGGDGPIQVADAVLLLGHLFRGEAAGAPPCEDACDSNDDGDLDLSDAVRILIFLFGGGPPPLRPYPDRGADPTPDALGCVGLEGAGGRGAGRSRSPPGRQRWHGSPRRTTPCRPLP
ncbi:MAG: hypothetical protein HY721_32890 [Planctomycetes bacterium]|nr:hypothetical protein [Planctomycetota bacterium]